MDKELSLVGGLKLERNGRLNFVCVRANLWNKINDKAVLNVMKMYKNMGYKVKSMKVGQLWALIGFEEETIEVDFVGANDVRIR